MTMAMRCSVILPVHNKAPYLRECLDSILAQHHSDYELLAVDDASSDESPAILSSYTDPRLRVITLARNVGPGMAAQRAMDEAKGDVLLRVDADDVLHPDRFTKQVALLRERPEIGLCGTAIALVHDPATVRRNPGSDADIRAQLLFGVGVYQPTMAVRRSVVATQGIKYREDWPWYGEDWLFQLDLIRATQAANIDEPLVMYREGPQNMAHGRDRRTDLADLHRRVLQAFGSAPPTDEQLALHAWSVKFFREPPTPGTVIAYREWLTYLIGASHLVEMPQVALERRVERAWEELYHHLVPFGPRVLAAYLAAGGKLGAARAYYALRMWMKRQPS
jgi:glycosyltransferase involved in cell wall biosynthesis